jgi:small-conductance mechanosensitive channel
MEETIANLWDELRQIFNSTLFNLGETEFSLLSIIILVISIFLVFYLSGKIKNVLVDRILTRYQLELGIRQAIGTIVKYLITVLGLLIIIQSVGIDLSTLSILAGALGVGIGFGLQNVTDNFISGIIILFERPIKVGDRIEVNNVYGDVIEINARSTTIVTNDNINIIVPNSEFISKTVINWSHTDRKVRFRFAVGVSYKEDPAVVRHLLLQVADENDGVLKTPPPDVWFDAFGESSLDFYLSIWTTDYINRPMILKSQLYFAIFQKFKENGIEIPFPQRDLHLKSGFEKSDPQ